MIYNQKRYLELLKSSRNLENQGKSLYEENWADYWELSTYKGNIQSYVYWKSRNLFLILMEKFVNSRISSEEFCANFLELRQKLIYEYEVFIKQVSSEKWEYFETDPRSTKFGSFIIFIRAKYDNFSD